MIFRSLRLPYFREISFFYKRRHELKLRVLRRGFFSILGINYRGSVRLRDARNGLLGTQVTRYERINEGLLCQGVDGFSHFFEERFVISVKNAVTNLSNGSIFLHDSITRELKLIEESIAGLPVIRLLEEESRFNRVQKFESGRVKLGITSRNYFHAVIEEVPRLLRSNADTPVLLGPNGSWLGHELYGKSRLILAPHRQLIKVDEIEFTSSGFDTGYLHPKDLEVLRVFQEQVCTSSRNDLPTRVYISRINSRRSPINEKQVSSIFEKYGFNVIEPSSKTLADQISYFSNVTHIAGVSGAGLVNALWGRNASLLEIMPLDRINRCFEFMCSISGQEYQSFTFQSHKFPINVVELERRIVNFISVAS
jgi:hypothetical protein